MATPNALSSSMTQAIELLESLTTLLMAERTALKDRDTLNIQAQLNKKTELLKQLEHNASTRTQLLIDSGVEGNDQGMTAYLNSLPVTAATELGNQWQTLKEQLHSCQAANQVNGTILHRSKTQAETLLNIFRGQSGSQKIYTGTGKSTAIGGGHSLAKA